MYPFIDLFILMKSNELLKVPQCALVAQSDEHQTLDFCSGSDLWVMGLSPALGPMLREEPTWDSVSVCPSPGWHSLSLINK